MNLSSSLRQYFLAAIYQLPWTLQGGDRRSCKEVAGLKQPRGAGKVLKGLNQAAPMTSYEAFRREMDDDFNTPAHGAFSMKRARQMVCSIAKNRKGREKERGLLPMLLFLACFQEGYFERKKKAGWLKGILACRDRDLISHAFARTRKMGGSDRIG